MDIGKIVSKNVTRHRLAKSMSISQLARASGVSKATLLSIEFGEGNPTLNTLQAIADALNVDFQTLISATSNGDNVEVRRAEEAVFRTMGGMRMRPLSTFYRSEVVYVFTASVDEDGVISDPHENGSAEGLLVLEGTVLAGPSTAPVELKQGDWMRFSTESPHICRAVGGTAEVVFLAARKSLPVNDSGDHLPNPLPRQS